MTTVHSGVRQGDDVETWIGTEMQEGQAPETGGIHHRNQSQLTQEKQANVGVERGHDLLRYRYVVGEGEAPEAHSGRGGLPVPPRAERTWLDCYR
jgi:hypothetical protein